jgi:hypothetical protein
MMVVWNAVFFVVTRNIPHLIAIVAIAIASARHKISGALRDRRHTSHASHADHHNDQSDSEVQHT